MTSYLDRDFDYRTLIASCLLLLPIGVHIFWSNMSVYAMSYLYQVQGSSAEYDIPWVISLVLLNRSLVLLMVEPIANVVGTRCVLLVGILLFNTGMTASYFSVQTSPAMLDATMGALCGFGGALLNGAVLKCVLVRYKTAVGLVSGIVLSSYPIGAIVITEFVTLYINPHNEVPTRRTGNDVILFSQREVLDKVPFAFLILGCCSSITQLVGFLLFKNSINQTNGCLCSRLISNNSKETAKLTGSVKDTNGSSKIVTNSDSTETSSSDSLQLKVEADSREYSTRQVLCSSAFYVLWAVNFLHQYPYLLVANYYKVYGQLWIKNDHLLANLSTVMAISSVIIRVLNGVTIDKLGVKNNLVGLLSLTALSAIFFYSSIIINKWFYFVTISLFTGLSSAQTSSFAVATLKSFGKKYPILKFGLITSSNLLMLLAAPPIMQFTLLRWGWFTLSTQAGAITAINAILVSTCLPYVS